MVDLTYFTQLGTQDHGLAVVVTLRSDGGPQTSVVNAGVLAHPLTGESVVAFVAVGGARKLANLRANPTISVVMRAGWQWASVDGTAQLIGPADGHPDLDAERMRLLLREIFTAAGGTHDDWDTYDRVMREEGRTAVLVTPTRATANPA